MKADSGNLLYIIISIVLLIISAIGKANKKAAQKPPVRPQAPSPMDEPIPTTGLPKEFEEIFGKIFQEEQPKAPEPEEVFEEAKSYETIVPENYKPEYESLEVIEEEDTRSLETIIAEEKLPIKDQEPILPEEQYETRNEILEGFEMQKAIVYAEIINRKYF